MLKFRVVKFMAAAATVTLSSGTTVEETDHHRDIKNFPEHYNQNDSSHKQLVKDKVDHFNHKPKRNDHQENKVLAKNENRYSGIPSIPIDIGYSKQSDRTSVAASVLKNPAVIAGMGVTVLALLGMMRSSFLGDRIATQKFMRYRIYGQFFTFASVVIGIIYLTEKMARQDEKKKEYDKAIQNEKNSILN